MVICRFSATSKWVRHYIADGLNFLTPIDAGNAAIGLSQMGVGVDATGNLTCSFARNNTLNTLNIDYSQTYMAVAYGQGKATDLHTS